MVEPGHALDAAGDFIVIPNLFGNGLSSSPSNAVAPANGNRWPRFTIADYVRIQRQMLLQVFGIEKRVMASG